MFAGVEDWFLLKLRHSRLLVLGEVFVPGDDDGVHVADAAAGGEDAVTFTPADDVPHLEQDLMLHHDEHGGNLIGEHIGVGGGCEPLPGHAHDVQTLRQLVEEVGMSSPDLVPEGGPAVGDQLLQGEARVGEGEVHGLGDLGRVVEVDDICVPVISLVDEVQEYLDDSIEELTGQLLSIRSAYYRKNILEMNK